MDDCISVTLGAWTLCSDGACGEVTRIVLDPRARVVSHVVVEPKHRQGLGRLVSLALIDCFSASIVLSCTSDEFDSLAHAEETQLLPGTGGRAAYVAGRPLSEPYEGLVDVIGEVPQPVTYDSIPRGKVELRGDELVRATDGEFGKVRGSGHRSEQRRRGLPRHPRASLVAARGRCRSYRRCEGDRRRN